MMWQSIPGTSSGNQKSTITDRWQPCMVDRKWWLWHWLHSKTNYHRLCGSASPVLTATHHYYGSPRLSDFFPAHFWRSDPPTDFNAKWLKRRAFMQGCAFSVKITTFHTPWSTGPLKGQNFTYFWTFGNFFARFGLTLEVRERTPLILYRSPMKVTYWIGKVVVINWNMYLNFT